MGKSNNTPNIPKAPDPVKSYQGFIDAYLKNQPTLQNAEDTSRATEDPLRIAQQQNLQNEFGPEQYQQMSQAFQQLDPAYFGTHNQLANTIGNNLSTGGPFAGAYGNQYNEGQGLFGQSQNLVGQNQNLVNNLQSQYAQGTQLDPGQSAQIEQSLRGAQAARGNASGDSAGIAEGYAKGAAGLQLQQQRLQNLEGGLAQTGSALGQSGSAFGASGQALGAASGYNQQNISNAGSFLGLPSLAQQSSFVAPVSADRSFSYINPNAGFQGVSLANQGYANQLGAAGLSQNTSGNPWMSAIGGLGSIAGGLLAASRGVQ